MLNHGGEKLTDERGRCHGGWGKEREKGRRARRPWERRGLLWSSGSSGETEARTGTITDESTASAVR
ncbi:hypothetical protein E2562_019922 [Oryza meyeriana var. granulata]|uniref:Uncharacterized protein n=1 Tax=Oryza meyeriana var. granulata TaxID=110450 RepID=A0A6G1EXL3_9ORYZ|nr:hypothetical protein E2562_019922 [Oryza meyeriana var. granulata]